MSIASDISKLPFDKAIIEADILSVYILEDLNTVYYDFRDASTLMVDRDVKVMTVLNGI